ncbi:MAG: hypothetical protein JXB09_06375, partial [Deltaproteobacteria bacterium]|nr:hypothetical protein [Deltaproteobacteria bacterium]
MKKIVEIALTVLFCATVACADEVDEVLAGMANEQIRNTTRQMIQAGISSDDAIKMIQLMLSNRFSQQTVQRAQEMLMNAVREGLPAEPIMNKAYEGMAKKVQSETIVQAMETVRSRYAFAYRQAGLLMKETGQVRSLGNLMADTLSAGMGQGDMAILSGRLEERITKRDKDQAHKLATETFRTARDMARLGASPSSVIDVISQALRHQYSAQEMETLRNSFMHNARQGAADNLAKSYAGEIGEGKSVQGLGSPDAAGPSGSGSGSGSGSSGGSGGSSDSSGGSGGGSDSSGGAGGSSDGSGGSGGGSDGSGGAGGSSDGSGGSGCSSDGSGGSGGSSGGSGEAGGGN